jgi:UDP-GlcNAc:undecaprenyl-phosphate GlcNAc-1-phosphate transferase
MFSLLFLSSAAFLLCLALTPLFRVCCTRLGLVDQPDRLRKLHARAVPRVGGIPLAIAYVGAFGLLFATPLSGGALVGEHLSAVLKLLPAACVVFLTGLCDDLWNVRPWQKLGGQIAAALLAWAGGVQVNSVAGWVLPDWLSLPLTVLWLAGCANAFNLIDGIDGLAAGIGLFATLTMLAAALLHGSFALALATAPLAGALLAFLRYNFNPASIFLGDSGSLLIGFLLGCYGALWSQKSATALGMTAPLMALAIPILDVLLAVCRRFLRGLPIFAADRGHIHHRLLDRGLSPRRAALVLYALCGVGATLSLLASLLDNRFTGLILVVFCLAAWRGVRSLGYVEFAAAGRVLWGGALRRLLTEQIQLAHLRESIRAARTPFECWQAMRNAAPGLGVVQVRLHLAGETFGEPEAPVQALSQLRIPVREGEWVDCWFRQEDANPPLVLAMFSQVVSQELRARAAHMLPSFAPDPQVAALGRRLAELEAQRKRQDASGRKPPSKLGEPAVGLSGAE